MMRVEASDTYQMSDESAEQNSSARDFSFYEFTLFLSNSGAEEGECAIVCLCACMHVNVW